MSSPFPTSVSRCLHHALGYLQLNLELVKCEAARCTPQIIQAYRHTTKTFHIKTHTMRHDSLMSFSIGNQDKFQTNSSVHSINTRNKHHLHIPIANLSCFQKGTSYSGIRIFNNLPGSITSLQNEKPQFQVALKIFLCAHSFLLCC